MMIRQNIFRGIIPKLDARMLPDGNLVTARNCFMDTGKAVPIKEPLLADSVTAGHTTIFRYNDGWLSWAGDVDVVRSHIEADQYNRIYYTGDGVPKVRGIDGSEEEWNLGIPKPSAAPTVAAAAKSSTGWTRTWAYWYEESDGTKKDEGTLTEGTTITETTVGTVFTAPVAGCPRVTASVDATLVIVMTAYSSEGTLIGRAFPDISVYEGATDTVIDGAIVTTTQLNDVTNAVVTLVYDTGDEADYTVARAYVYTFVSAWGEEGPPSDPSTVTDISPVQNGYLSGIDTSVASGYNIELVRIYRTRTTDAGTNYYLVAEIDFGDSTYTDTMNYSDLVTILPSNRVSDGRTVRWDAPPTDGIGIVAHPGQFFAMFSGKTLYLSEPGFPHAWPYRYTVSDDIVGLGISGITVVVATVNNPFCFVGSNPALMTEIKRSFEQSCVAKLSIVDDGDAVFYASPDGLVMVIGETFRLLTGDHYQKADWQALSPEDFNAELFDGKYIAFKPDGDGIIIPVDYANFKGRDITTHGVNAVGVYVDNEADQLYLIDGGEIYEWDGGEDNLEMTVESRQYDSMGKLTFACGFVNTDEYPVTLQVYLEGELKATKTVSNGDGFRLPDIPIGRRWAYKITAESQINDVCIATSMNEMREA